MGAGNGHLGAGNVSLGFLVARRSGTVFLGYPASWPSVHLCLCIFSGLTAFFMIGVSWLHDKPTFWPGA